MAMYNRLRDHSANTAAFIRENLKHADGDFGEFAAWQNTYQEYFETDFSPYASKLDGVLTECRNITASALRNQELIEQGVSDVTDSFALKVRESTDQLKNYSNVFGAAQKLYIIQPGNIHASFQCGTPPHEYTFQSWRQLCGQGRVCLCIEKPIRV